MILASSHLLHSVAADARVGRFASLQLRYTTSEPTRFQGQMGCDLVALGRPVSPFSGLKMSHCEFWQGDDGMQRMPAAFSERKGLEDLSYICQKCDNFLLASSWQNGRRKEPLGEFEELLPMYYFMSWDVMIAVFFLIRLQHCQQGCHWTLLRLVGMTLSGWLTMINNNNINND